jgi:hypothetical protein
MSNISLGEDSPILGAIPNPRKWESCIMINDETKLNCLFYSGVMSAIIYSLMFLLGCRNIWCILIRQQYYKSWFMSLQYLFGQIVCALKIVSLWFWWDLAVVFIDSHVCTYNDI